MLYDKGFLCNTLFTKVYIIILVAIYAGHGICLADNKPQAPTLEVVQNGISIALSWDVIPNADSYTLFYAPYPDVSYVADVDMGKKTSISFELESTGAYYVVARAFNKVGKSEYSNIEFFGILKVKKEGDTDNNGTIDRLTIYTFNLNGQILKEERDLNNDGETNKTILYSYNDWGGISEAKVELTNNFSMITSYTFFGSLNEKDNFIEKQTLVSIAYQVKTDSYTYLCNYSSPGKISREMTDLNNDGVFDEVYHYDSNGYLIGEEDWVGFSDDSFTSFYTYDSNENIIKEKIDNGDDKVLDEIHEYFYDEKGNKTKELHSLVSNGTIDRITEYTYNSNDNIIKEEVDTNGNGTIDEIYHYYWP